MEWYVIATYAGIAVLIAVLVFLYIRFRKKMQNKMAEQKEIVDQHRMTASILVIEKKKGKITEAGLPKKVVEQVPRLYRMKKIPLITAKVGPQVVTLTCEDDLYDQIPEKKSITVDLAGIFIVEVKQSKQQHNQKKRR